MGILKTTTKILTNNNQSYIIATKGNYYIKRKVEMVNYNILRQFGFTESEMKVYLALLQNGHCTGYEVSKHSGVARSKVYGVLDSLHRKGAVEKALNSDKNNLYKAVQAKKMRKILSKKMQLSLDEFERQTEQYETPKDYQQMWVIQDYSATMAEALEIIENAREELLIQIWCPELQGDIEKALLGKEKEGVDVLTILYDMEQRYHTSLINVYQHGFEREKISDNGASWFTIVADRKAMLHTSLINEKNVQGVYTQNKSMVYFAREYVLHDAYCLKLLNEVKMLNPDFDVKEIRHVFR